MVFFYSKFTYCELNQTQKKTDICSYFPKLNLMNIEDFIVSALREDIGSGDHTALACLDANSHGTAQLIVKDTGIVAGIELAEQIFKIVDPALTFNKLIEDGASIKYGDIAFTVTGNDQKILTSERLVLNCMQRMSAIATHS